MIGAVDFLDEVEALDRGALLRVIGQPAQEARHGQAHVARVFRIAEAAPLGVFHRVEHLGQVARAAQVGEAVQAQQLGRGRGDERGVRGRGHVRHLLDEVHVLGLARDLEIAQQRAEGRAAEGAELFFVDLLEHQALVEVDRGLEVAHQVALGDVEHLDLEHGAGVALLAQVVQAAPGAFQLLEFGAVHHLAQLGRDQAVQLGHPGVQHRRQVVGDDHGALHDFARQFADQVLGAVVFGAGLGDAALLDDLVQQARFGLGGRRGRVLRGGGITHCCLPCRPCRLRWSVAAVSRCC